MSAPQRFKLSHEIQTQACFLSASFHWLPSSWRHHAGRGRGALQFGARRLSGPLLWKLPCSVSPWQLARQFPEALAEVGGARPELPPGIFRQPSDRGRGLRSQGSGCEWDGCGQGLAVPSARGRGGACWVWINGFWVFVFSFSLLSSEASKAQVPWSGRYMDLFVPTTFSWTELGSIRLS